MSLTSTGTRVLAAALVVLALFVIAFLVARSSSSEAAPAAVREQPVAGAEALEHAPLRAIGQVPALPRAARRRTPPKTSPKTSPPPAAPPPVFAPPPPPPTRPPPSPEGCAGEFC